MTTRGFGMSNKKYGSANVQDSGALREMIEKDPAFYSLFSAKVAADAAALIEQQAERVRKRTAFATSILGLALVGVFGFGFQFFKQQVSDLALVEARSMVDEQGKKLRTEDIAPLNSRISDVSASVFLLRAIGKLEDGEGFTQDEAARIISALNARNDVADRSNKEFDDALRVVVLSFLQADRRDLVKQLEARHGAFINSDPQIAEFLVQSLGLELLSVPGDPKAFGGSARTEWEEMKNEFEKFAEILKRQNAPAIPLFYELMIAFVEHESDATILAMMSKLDSMGQQEREILLSYAKSAYWGSWTKKKSGATSLITQRTFDFKNAYSGMDATGTVARFVERE